MKKTASGLEIIRNADSTIKGKTVALTRKTNKAGEIRHGVVLTNTRNGRHHRIGTFTKIAPAFKLYKSLAV